MRMRMNVLLVVLAVAGSTGCFKVHMMNEGIDPKDSHDEWENFFFYGLAGHAQIDTRDFCKGEEVARIDYGMNFGTWLVGWVSLGIYTPNVVTVTCGTPYSRKAASFEVEFDRAGAPALVTERLPDREPRSAAPRFSASAEEWTVTLPAREAL